MIARHYHWKFSAFNGPEPTTEAPTVQWQMFIEVVGYDTEEGALIAARSIVTRDCFHLYSVWECASCGFQEQTAETLRTLANQGK